MQLEKKKIKSSNTLLDQYKFGFLLQSALFDTAFFRALVIV